MIKAVHPIKKSPCCKSQQHKPSIFRETSLATQAEESSLQGEPSPLMQCSLMDLPGRAPMQPKVVTGEQQTTGIAEKSAPPVIQRYVKVGLYEGSFGLDHIGIGVNSEKTSGFSPKEGLGREAEKGSWVEGEVKEDHGLLDSLTIRTNPRQEAWLQAALNRAESSSQKFNLHQHNCSQHGAEILKSAGLNAKSSPVPRAFFEGLKKKYASGQKEAAADSQPVQGKFTSNASAAAEPRTKPNRTGMPDRLKSGIESLSGMDMSDVRVHANSELPARLDALAYTQGNQIYLGPGEEKHLPHEAWHVVQQKQGRVRATRQMKGVGVNDDLGLEGEANVLARRIDHLEPFANSRQASFPVAFVPASCIQLAKKRIQINDPNDERGKEMAMLIAEAKEIRARSKDDAYLSWISDMRSLSETFYNATSEGAPNEVIMRLKKAIEERHNNFIAEIARIREIYDISINNIIRDYGLDKAVDGASSIEIKTGLDYFGELQGEIRTQKDTGKQYVRDAEGYYVPRYALRHITKKERTPVLKRENLSPKGYNREAILKSLKDKFKKFSFGENELAMRSFYQNRAGGQHQTAMISGTASERPIRGNSGSPFTRDSGGAIIIDNAEILSGRSERSQLSSQYVESLNPYRKRTMPKMQALSEDRDTRDKYQNRLNQEQEKAASSGARNKELHYTAIPFSAIQEVLLFAENDSTSIEQREDIILREFRAFKNEKRREALALHGTAPGSSIIQSEMSIQSQSFDLHSLNNCLISAIVNAAEKIGRPLIQVNVEEIRERLQAENLGRIGDMLYADQNVVEVILRFLGLTDVRVILYESNGNVQEVGGEGNGQILNIFHDGSLHFAGDPFNELQKNAIRGTK